MSEATETVDYVQSARRHLRDARHLKQYGSNDNAGQLFGLCVECGLKALLLACGVKAGRDGRIVQKDFYQHMPDLENTIVALSEAIPHRRRAVHYRAMLISLASMEQWSVHQRYKQDSPAPHAALSEWENAAIEVENMIDDLVIDGVNYELPV